MSDYESVGLEECLGRSGQVGVPPVWVFIDGLNHDEILKEWMYGS